MRPGEPSLTRRVQLVAIGVTVVSFGTTLAFTPLPLAVQVVLVVLCLCVVGFLAKQPTLPSES